MDIDKIFSLPTIFVSIFTGIIVYLFKTQLELRFIDLAQSKEWKNIVVPSVSILVAVLIVLFSGLMPDWIAGARLVDKIGFGVLTGFSSSYLFRALKTVLVSQGGAE